MNETQYFSELEIKQNLSIKKKKKRVTNAVAFIINFFMTTLSAYSAYPKKLT